MDTAKWIAKQEEIGEEVRRIVANFKKDSASRKTTSAYFKARLEQLHVQWEQFYDNDAAISATLDEENEYTIFAKEIGELYEEFSELFAREARRLEEAEEAGKAGKSGMPPPPPPPMPTKTGASKELPLAPVPLKLTKFSTVKEPMSSDKTTLDSVKTAVVTKIRQQKAVIVSLQKRIDGLKSRNETGPCAELEYLWRKVQDLHFEIHGMCDEPSQYGYNVGVFDKVEAQVDKFRAVPGKDAPHLGGDLAQVQLPKISIPTFSGDYLQWQQFADIFRKMINEKDMPKIQKMWYLKANLGGEAERMIRHLALTEENYDASWDLLKERYDNRRVIVTNLVRKIVDYPAVPNDATAMKNFYDCVFESLAALDTMKINTTTWDPILIVLLQRKLDKLNSVQYEQSVENIREVQTMKGFMQFVEKRFVALESIGANERYRNRTTAAVATDRTTGQKCKVCGKEEHQIYYCEKFLVWTTGQRESWIRKNKLCLNCLRPGHVSTACEWRSCTKCGRKHNSLLHSDTKSVKILGSKDKTPTTIVAAANGKDTQKGYVMLATARVVIRGNNGRQEEFRALLDSGSQVNLVSERLVKRLALPADSATLQIEGIGGKSRASRSRVNVELRARMGTYSTRLEAFVLPQIISAQPSRKIDVGPMQLPEGYHLADPTFYQPNKVDVLLGAEFYYELLRPKKMQLRRGMPPLQDTELGWIVAGKIVGAKGESTACGIAGAEEQNMDVLLQRFWKLDEFSDEAPRYTATEKRCEEHFVKHVGRIQSGQFIVRLPFSEHSTALGESRRMAETRFAAIERRLSKNPTLRQGYVNFMHEYEAMGHMTEISASDIPRSNCFIPHHCVVKPDSLTTKLRVVFDASAKTSSGRSLNDILHVGPTVQSELLTILLRFRMHRYVFTADIEKMYRQIFVDKDDQMFQLIVWRSAPDSKLRYFRLRTVTYGTASAPYLATKCLQYLATQERTSYPLGAQTLHDDFYVDDCLTGADSMNEALLKRDQLVALLGSAGFNLRKWCANKQQLLEGIPSHDQAVDLSLGGSTVKTLGLLWKPGTDRLCGRARLEPRTAMTKRSVSSDLASIFDPLGLFAPVVTTAKIFLQQLWQLKTGWDDPLPEALQLEWNRFRSKVEELNNVELPRHVLEGGTPKSMQLHVFADASEKAYGAVAYLRSTGRDGTVVVRLLCAKSRVAPLARQTLPRLELCAAVLAAELAHRIKKDLRLTTTTTHLWSDSEIVISWINAEASSFHTFVANRVAKIAGVSLAEQWRHVPSKENPADLVSRGMAVKDFVGCGFWFFGPIFLHGPETQWPVTAKGCHEVNRDDAERKIKPIVATAKVASTDDDWLYLVRHRNSFRMLQRVMAYVGRFVKNVRRTQAERSQNLELSPQEMENGLQIIVRKMQQLDFSKEIRLLQRNEPLGKGSHLNQWTPYLDQANILRVGGRTDNASHIAYDARHPILLPYNDPLVKLLVRQEHEENSHCGQQALTNILRQRFCIIKAKIMVRNVIHQCVRCARVKPKMAAQIMGNLPADRVTPSRPFFISGVDYAGPFWVHYKIRGKRPHKVYLAVFCCFATKAVHLEVVTDLTTDAFLGALNRFISRRGKVKKLYSDNATNFVGASNQLRELQDAIFADDAQHQIKKSCSDKGMEFIFIPPGAPHFGGLWEAAVKSAKRLMLKTIQSTNNLTHEELETVVIGIEGILNSRPLTPVSTDPNDLTALTPGHFLIGEPMTAPIDVHAKDGRLSLASRWTQVRQLQQEFWTRWSTEYLKELQARPKWQTKQVDLQEGDMVVIRDENQPPLRWALGRIVHTIKGDDNAVRVADVRTSTGTLRRPIHRLAPLPVDNTPPPDVTTLDPANSSPVAEEPTPAKRKRYGHTSPVTVALVVILLLPLALANPINITRFDSKPGVFFEGIGTTKFVASTWKMIVYFDLEPYRQDMAALKNGTTTMRSLCEKLAPNPGCEMVITHFEHMYDELMAENEIIKPGRQKRGAANIIGNVARTLFGVLDSEYANDMSATITKLKNNDDFLLDLMRNQTTVIDSTVNVLRKEGDAMHVRLGKMKQEIDKIIMLRDELMLFQWFTALSTQMALLTTRLQRMQGEITRALTDVHHGTISPVLLSPQQLKDQINKMKIQLRVGQTFPVEQTNLLQLYKLMSAEGAATSKHIVFQIMLPLVGQQQFDLFNLVPIPVNIDGVLQVIHPDKPILAVNAHRDQFVPMTQHDLEHCQLASEESYICATAQSVYSARSEALTCEIQLLNEQTSPSCRTSPVQRKFLWEPMSHKNQWIFASITSVEMTTVCKDYSARISLKGSGLLVADPSCTLHNSDIIVQGHSIKSTAVHVSYARLSITVPELTFAKVANNDDSLEKLDLTIQHLKIPKHFPDTFSVATHHHYFAAYGALLCSVLVGIIVIMRRYRQRSRQKVYDVNESKATSRPDAPPPAPSAPSPPPAPPALRMPISRTLPEPRRLPSK